MLIFSIISEKRSRFNLLSLINLFYTWIIFFSANFRKVCRRLVFCIFVVFRSNTVKKCRTRFQVLLFLKIHSCDCNFGAWKVFLFFGLRITGAAFVSQIIPEFLWILPIVASLMIDDWCPMIVRPRCDWNKLSWDGEWLGPVQKNWCFSFSRSISEDSFSMNSRNSVRFDEDASFESVFPNMLGKSMNSLRLAG